MVWVGNKWKERRYGCHVITVRDICLPGVCCIMNSVLLFLFGFCVFLLLFVNTFIHRTHACGNDNVLSFWLWLLLVSKVFQSPQCCRSWCSYLTTVGSAWYQVLVCPEKSTFCTINNRVGTLRPMFVRLNTLSTNMLYCCTVDRCMEFVFFFFHLTEPNACKEVAWICRELNQCAYVSLETTCWTVGNSCFDHWRRAIGDFWLVYSIPDIILSGLAQSIN